MNISNRLAVTEQVLDTDLATYLHTLAARLRGLALAIPVPARRDGDRGDAEAAALLELAAAQERIARALELAAHRLCDRCKLTGVTETVTWTGAPVLRRYRMSRKVGRAEESGPPAWC